MFTPRQMIRIGVIGDIPEMDELRPAEFVADQLYEVSVEPMAPQPALDALDRRDVQLLVTAGSETRRDFETLLDAIFESDPFCPVLLFTDPDRADQAFGHPRQKLTGYGFRLDAPSASAALLENRLRETMSRWRLLEMDHGDEAVLTEWAPHAYSDNPMLIVDEKKRIRYINQSLDAIHYERTGEHFPAELPYTEILTEVDQPGFSMRVDAALRGKSWKIQKNVSVVEGPDTWHEYVYEPVRDASGRIVGAAMTIRDIGYRKRTEEKLQESEERFWTFFEGVQFGMVVVDPDARFLHANSAFCEMLDMSESELRDTPVLDVTHPDDATASAQAIKGLLQEGQNHIKLEKRYLRPDGSTVWADVVAWPIRDPDGEPRYFIGMIVDITERKQIQDQLQQTEKLQAVGQLAAGIAHEFNNLLMAIVSYAHILKDDLPEDAAGHTDVEKIYELAERGADLTAQLLTYSRQKDTHPELLDLNAIVGDAAQLMRSLLDETITIDAELADGLPAVEADPAQIEQVLMNLMLNARDAMPDGGTLTLATRHRQISEAGPKAPEPFPNLEPGPYVVLDVRDTGTGMTDSTRERIFEPFFSTKETGEGTGLGLSMVYGIIHQMNGTIRVDTEPGRGTRFTLFFPAEDVEADKIDSGGYVEVPSNHRPHDATILLVENDDDVRRALVDGLAETGFEILEATSARDALEISRRHAAQIDLLLTDVLMPDHSGPELADRLSRERDDLDILFMSGYDGTELDARLDARAIDAPVLTKPLSIDALHRTICTVLDS